MIELSECQSKKVISFLILNRIALGRIIKFADLGLTDLKKYSISDLELAVTDEKKWLLAQIKYPELTV